MTDQREIQSGLVIANQHRRPGPLDSLAVLDVQPDADDLPRKMAEGNQKHGIGEITQRAGKRGNQPGNQGEEECKTAEKHQAYREDERLQESHGSAFMQ